MGIFNKILKCCVFLMNILVLMSSVISSCANSETEKETDKITTYSMQLSNFKKPNLNDLYLSIEIDTLEFSSQSLIGNPFHGKHYIHVKNKFHIFIDDRYVINIFNLEGEFISSSSRCIGKGPEQYLIMQDVNYNPYADTVEILDPFGNIMIYDSCFNFHSKHKIKIKSSERFRYFYPVSKELYILIDKSESSSIHLYNLVKGTGKVMKYEGAIAPVSANVSPIREFDDILYFYPPQVNNYIFSFNPETNSLIKEVHIESEQYINKEDIRRFKDNLDEVLTFITTNNKKYTPLNRFLSDQYLYTLLMKENRPFINILNIMTGKSLSFLKDPLFEKNIPNCQYIEGNTMYAIIQPDEIDDFIETHLLVNKEILSSIKEDGNPLIVKYRLKI